MKIDPNSPAYPPSANTNGVGLTIRMWLVGEILSGMAAKISNIKDEDIAKAFEIADKAIAKHD